MTSADETSAYDRCVGALDVVAGRLRSNTISPDEYEMRALEALSTYLEADRPEDDLDLLLQYARLPIEQHGEDPVDGDRTAAEGFHRQVQSLFHYPASRANLRERLDDIGRRMVDGDDQALEDLRTLCHSGWRDHPHLFMFRDNINLTLQAAYEFGAVEALVDAMLPTRPDPGPIASAQVFGGSTQRYALDLLATLATHGDAIGEQAVDALLHLVDFLELAAAAAVRLPSWRLGREHRERLLAQLEAVSELLDRDPFLVPIDDATRIPHILRSTIWLANDAARITP